MTQPKALFLADVIESDPTSAAHHDEAAAELRRLSAENERIGPLAERVLELKAQRDALLEALKVVIDDLMYQNHARVIDVARAAIKQAEGGQ